MRQLLRSSARVLLALGGLALLAVAIAASSFWVTEDRSRMLSEHAAVLEHSRAQVSILGDAINDEELALADLLLTGEPDAVAAYQQALATERATSAVIPTVAAQFPAVVAAGVSLDAKLSEWHRTVADPVIAAVQAGTDVSTFRPLLGDWHETLDTARIALSHATDDVASQLDAESNAVAGQRMLALGFGLAVATIATAISLVLVRGFSGAMEHSGRNATVVNRFTEVTSFAPDDASVARSTLEALDLLVHPDSSVVYVLNRSKDRAVPEASTGDVAVKVLPLHDLSRCAGVQRGSMYVVSDAAAPLSVRCPVFPVDRGTLACIPLSSGEWVGSVHLAWKEPEMLPLDLRGQVLRIVEHAALAISNRRLLAMLQGQANTDPRTGLANTRSFDEAVQRALEELRPGETACVLMLDVDHFKDFNDRYGHPAGDDALRSLAGVLQSCMRADDLAARYGGEEFAVLLDGTSREAAFTIAERIRSRTESTILSLAPGLSARLTVSIGIASAPDQATERLSLLRIADQALYRAKGQGRNRVVAAWTLESTDDAGAGPDHPGTDEPEPRPQAVRRLAASTR